MSALEKPHWRTFAVFWCFRQGCAAIAFADMGCLSRVLADVPENGQKVEALLLAADSCQALDRSTSQDHG
ncbi:hypothetical protein CSQ89_00215 [Chitinimonas sp. BJB300]|nr:hypothetical protein CSQ89_00215 [Chitinimonas sp. BJB300]